MTSEQRQAGAAEFRAICAEVFGAHHGAIGEAARALGVSRRSLEDYRAGRGAIQGPVWQLLRLLQWLTPEQRRAWGEKSRE